MNRRDIVIGLAVLAILAGVIYWRQTTQTEEQVPAEPQTLSTEQKLEEQFNVTIPENVEKADLTDQTGGNAYGIATREYENDSFTLNILADLPEPTDGEVYQGWIAKDSEESVSVGQLRIAKGGWTLEFNSSTDFSDYNKVMVTEETALNSEPETTILEGSF
jgi:hypothetical protein